MTGTGLLTARCDPFGAESSVRLAGGLFPESMRGRHMWRCEKRAVGTYRMVCTGGYYGQRQAPDGGMVPGYHCDGGHKGQPMPLCLDHVAEFARQVRPKVREQRWTDGGGHEQWWSPDSRVGGTKANEMCPPCSVPAVARPLVEKANDLAGRIGVMQMMGLLAEQAKLEAELEGVSAELTMMNMRGIIHKCPLRLVEVS